MAGVKMKIVFFLGIFFMGLTLFCAGDNMGNETKKKVFVMTEGTESSITVKTTGEFFIKIESNPSTGYGWALQKITDETVMKFKGIKEDEEEEAEIEEESERPLLGAPGYETFIFEALKPGKATASLIYRRPWEKDVPPIKTYKIHITVE
jgi:inhibitor of cysteine peptidase